MKTLNTREFHKKVIQFYRDWNYLLLSSFYKSELNWLQEEYRIKEKNFYKDKSKEELYAEFSNDTIDAIAFICQNKEIKEQWEESSRDDFLEWITNNIGEEFNTILEALSRGYLIEWLFFLNPKTENTCDILENTPHRLGIPHFYNRWKDILEEGNFTRTQIKAMDDYNLYHEKCIFYRSVTEEKMFEVMFNGMNGHDLYQHNERIKRLLIKHCLLTDMQNIYDKLWKVYGKYNGWDRDLLKLCDEKDTDDIEYPEVTEDYLKYLNRCITDKCGINKIELLKRMYWYWHSLDANDGKLKKKLWYFIYHHLKDEKIIKEGRPPYKSFVMGVIRYVHHDIEVGNYSDMLRKGSPYVKSDKQEEYHSMGKRFKACIDEFIEALEKSAKH